VRPATYRKPGSISLDFDRVLNDFRSASWERKHLSATNRPQRSGNASCAASGDALRPGGCGIAGRGREGANEPSTAGCACSTQAPLRLEWLPEVELRPIFKWCRLIQPRRSGMVAAREGVRSCDFVCCLPHNYPASLSLRRMPPAPMLHASPCEHVVTLLVCADAWITDGGARFYAARPRDCLPHCGERVGPLVCVLAATTTTPAIFFYGASVCMRALEPAAQQMQCTPLLHYSPLSLHWLRRRLVSSGRCRHRRCRCHRCRRSHRVCRCV
jgi:hypothetical protein